MRRAQKDFANVQIQLVLITNQRSCETLDSLRPAQPRHRIFEAS